MTRTRSSRPGRLAAVLALMACLLGGLLLAPATPASAAAGEPPVPLPRGGPYLGPVLDWTSDDARSYADRLGATPSVYGQTVRYPLAPDDRTYLRQFVEQAAQQGALALLTLLPTKSLSALTEADARLLARDLAELHRRNDSRFLVRFAPEMNGSWVAWGQQPEAYRTAFRTIAAAVHAGVPQAAMLWSPAYGAGYPYGRAYGKIRGSGPRVAAQLDTDGDGRVAAGDDPYAPYWPGDDVVDWVGLSLYRYGAEPPFGRNEVPEAGEFEARLEDRFAYQPGAAPRRSFYATYAEAKRLPMAVETGVLYLPDAGGPSELEVKQTWARQVLDPSVQAARPRLALVAWLEKARVEEEADRRTVDWRITRTPELAQAFRAAAQEDRARLGPVTRVLDQEAGNRATAQYREGRDVGDNLTWIAGVVALSLVLWLVSGFAGRFVPSWRYPREGDLRDDRLDYLRGWIIVAVVITHIEVAGPYSTITLNAIGGITGAELFVLLSGVVLGMVHPVAVAKLGEWAAAVTAWRRARKQYLTALAVVLLVYLIGRIPGVSATVVTTFTDRGTGLGGTADKGQVYDLYANVQQLLDYPPPWYAVRALLLLEIGPWVFNIMGLFVVLSLLLPALMWLVRRGLWWLVLAGSWGLYVLDSHHHIAVLPSQFEAVFPLLTWQIAFTHGLVIGYYRRPLTRALTSTAGKAGVTVALVLYTAFLGWVWASRALDVPAPFQPGGGDDAYSWVYTNLYERTSLQAGRLLDLLLVLVVAHALLTTCWKPLDRALGWFYVPLGKVSLYVFIVHVFFVVAVANIPGLDRASVWQGALIHTAVLAIIWVMVKRRFLFKVIPT